MSSGEGRTRPTPLTPPSEAPGTQLAGDNPVIPLSPQWLFKPAAPPKPTEPAAAAALPVRGAQPPSKTGPAGHADVPRAANWRGHEPGPGAAGSGRASTDGGSTAPSGRGAAAGPEPGEGKRLWRAEAERSLAPGGGGFIATPPTGGMRNPHWKTDDVRVSGVGGGTGPSSGTAPTGGARFLGDDRPVPLGTAHNGTQPARPTPPLHSVLGGEGPHVGGGGRASAGGHHTTPGGGVAHAGGGRWSGISGSTSEGDGAAGPPPREQRDYRSQAGGGAGGGGGHGANNGSGPREREPGDAGPQADRWRSGVDRGGDPTAEGGSNALPVTTEGLPITGGSAVGATPQSSAPPPASRAPHGAPNGPGFTLGRGRPMHHKLRGAPGPQAHTQPPPSSGGGFHNAHLGAGAAPPVALAPGADPYNASGVVKEPMPRGHSAPGCERRYPIATLLACRGAMERSSRGGILPLPVTFPPDAGVPLVGGFLREHAQQQQQQQQQQQSQAPQQQQQPVLSLQGMSLEDDGPAPLAGHMNAEAVERERLLFRQRHAASSSAPVHVGDLFESMAQDTAAAAAAQPPPRATAAPQRPADTDWLSLKLGGALAPPPAPPPPEPPESSVWVYRDPQGSEQGPFDQGDIRNWYDGTFFPDDLPLRLASAPVNTPFRPLRDIFPSWIARDAVAEAPPPAPLAEPVQASPQTLESPWHLGLGPTAANVAVRVPLEPLDADAERLLGDIYGSSSSRAGHPHRAPAPQAAAQAASPPRWLGAGGGAAGLMGALMATSGPAGGGSMPAMPKSAGIHTLEQLEQQMLQGAAPPAWQSLPAHTRTLAQIEAQQQQQQQQHDAAFERPWGGDGGHVPVPAWGVPPHHHHPQQQSWSQPQGPAYPHSAPVPPQPAPPPAHPAWGSKPVAVAVGKSLVEIQREEAAALAIEQKRRAAAAAAAAATGAHLLSGPWGVGVGGGAGGAPKSLLQIQQEESFRAQQVAYHASQLQQQAAAAATWPEDDTKRTTPAPPGVKGGKEKDTPLSSLLAAAMRPMPAAATSHPSPAGAHPGAWGPAAAAPKSLRQIQVEEETAAQAATTMAGQHTMAAAGGEDSVWDLPAAAATRRPPQGAWADGNPPAATAAAHALAPPRKAAAAPPPPPPPAQQRFAPAAPPSQSTSAGGQLSFRSWCEASMRAISASNGTAVMEVGPLIDFLMSVAPATEVAGYISLYLGISPAASTFAADFIKLRTTAGSLERKFDFKGPPSTVQPPAPQPEAASDDGAWAKIAKSKGSKKKT